MDPITATGLIISLIGIFLGEHADHKNTTRQDFECWIEKHHFEDLKEFINNNNELSRELDRLLQQDHAVILDKLHNIESMLASVVNKSNLGLTIDAKELLSGQALNILTQFYQSEHMYLYYEHFEEMTLLIYTEYIEDAVNIEITAPLYIENDLDVMINRGLLKLQEPILSSSKIYSRTREGERLFKILP